MNYDCYSRCYLAHPTKPRAHEGCHKAYAHYGDCAHRLRLMPCLHTGGWYPCCWYPGEVHEPEFCPAREQDPGDEQSYENAQ